MAILPEFNTLIVVKRVLLTLALAIMFGYALDAQTKVVKDSTGNYVTVAASTKKKAGVKNAGAVKTKNTFKCAEGKLPIWKSKNGKFFVIRTSKKTGNKYNQYLKIEAKK